jgi:predicted DCC family thiol-disulfide oxidoreductase YuxK
MDAIYFDAECRFCVATLRRFERMLARRGFAFVPLQTPGTARRLGVPDTQLLDRMRLQRGDGTVVDGAAAIAAIARRVWWAWPLWALSRVPGVMAVMDAGYGWIARHRSCLNGECAVARRPGHSGWPR